MAKTQKNKLAFQRNELARSKRWRNTGAGESGYDYDWNRWIDLYSGKQWAVASGTDQMVINLVWSTVNVLVPAVAINNPRFVVNALKPEDAPQSVITEEVLNSIWQAGEFQREVRHRFRTRDPRLHRVLVERLRFMEQIEVLRAGAGQFVGNGGWEPAGLPQAAPVVDGL